MEPGHQLLNKLFHLWQSNPESSKRKSLPINQKRAPAYYQTVNPDEKDQLHACLINAEKAGCISLVWGKYPDSHLLQKIWLTDGESLARFLGIPLARDIAKEAQSKILERFPQNESWIVDLVSQICTQWETDRSAYNIVPGDIDEVITLIRALKAVRKGEHQELDLRTFSAKTLGDSKAMERIRDRFARVWNEKFNSGLDSKELYESLGLTKFPPALFLKGPLEVRIGDCWLDIAKFPPYLGVVPDSIDEIRLTNSPDYVLTVENLASFNRHCREINDNGITIFSSGFLGTATTAFLKRLDAKAELSLSFFHWGDIDEGGLRISRYIQSLLGRKLNLHLMTDELLKMHGKQIERISKKQLAVIQTQTSNPQIENLVTNFLSKTPGIVLEQENIDPVSPVTQEEHIIAPKKV